MSLTRMVAGYIVSGLLLSFSSCINEDYDLDKEIDTNMQVGSNLTVPIGSTDTIRLERLISEGDLLKAVDGRYVITTSDRITESITAVEEFIVEEFVPDIKPYVREFELSENKDVPVIPGLETPLINVKFDVDVSLRDSFEIHVDVPEEVKAVKYVKIVDDNYNDVEVVLHLDVSGVPSCVPVLHLVGGEFTVPPIVDFEVREEEGSIIQEGSKVYFSKDIVLTNGCGSYSIPVKVNGISNPEIWDGQLHLIDSVAFNGRLYVDEVQVGMNDLDGATITVSPRIEMPTPELRVTEVAGTVEPEVNISTGVSLDDLPDFLKEGDNRFGLKDLLLILTVNNPINAPIEAEVLLNPKDALGQVIEENQVELLLSIDAGGRSSFAINSVSDVIKRGTLTDLLSVVPDRVDLEVTRLVVDSKTVDQSIILGKGDYNISVDYDLEVPLEFNDLQIDYTEVITGLQSDLDGIIGYINDLELHVDIDHTIPVDLTLSAYPCDAMGNRIDGITLPDAIFVEAAPDSEGTIQSASVDIHLIETRAGALKEMDQLHVVVKGVSVENQEVTLRPNQYVVLHLSAKLPNGVHVDLNDL